MSNETVEAPSTTGTPIVEPKDTNMAKSAIDLLFKKEAAPEPTAPVVEKKVEPVQPTIQSNPIKQTKPTDNSQKSRTALEIDNLKSEYTAKIQEASGERDTLKARMIDMESELTTLKDKASSTADYAEIRQKNKELEEVVTRLDIQQHPEFKKKYTIQEEHVFGQVKNVLAGVENGEQIINALKMAPSPEREAKLDELKQDLGITKISKLATYEARLDDLRGQKEFEISNAEIARRLYNEEQQQMAATQKKAEDQIFNKYVQHFSENDPTYQKREGDDAFNQNVDARLTEARRLYYEASPDDRAQAMLAAVDRPILMALIKKLGEELTSSNTALNGKLEATPGVGATRKDEPTKSNSFVESIRNAMTS